MPDRIAVQCGKFVGIFWLLWFQLRFDSVADWQVKLNAIDTFPQELFFGLLCYVKVAKYGIKNL